MIRVRRIVLDQSRLAEGEVGLREKTYEHSAGDALRLVKPYIFGPVRFLADGVGWMARVNDPSLGPVMMTVRKI